MLADIVDTAIWVFTILIFGRIIMSWIPNIIDPRGPIGEFLITTTEPILAPIRAVMPRLGMFDLSPMIAIILLRVVGSVLIELLRNA